MATLTGGLKVSKYLVLFEKSSTGYGAYAPDLPGCIATGRTLRETRCRMTKAVEMHLAAMREDGDEIQRPEVGQRKSKTAGWPAACADVDGPIDF